MLYSALEFIRLELTQSIVNAGGNAETVQLGNIALISDNSGGESEHLYLSLINVQEEMTRKNRMAYKKNSLNGVITYQNPPLSLNLFMLISAHYKNYATGLQMLSLAISFFQGKNIFTFANSSVETTSEFNLTEEDQANFKIIVDLYSLTFEQINYLWGSLGGKQVPFLLYKLRLVEIDNKQPQKSGSAIEEINTLYT